MTFARNCRQQGNGLNLLRSLDAESVAVAFFDPQYRGVLDKLDYGNEGARQIERAKLRQMDEGEIVEFISNALRILRPSGHLFLWLDKFHLCEGFKHWVPEGLDVVDLITWDKRKIGMGYRTRRRCEYLLVMQKEPKRAKDVWTDHSIPDVWAELPRKAENDQLKHPHAKPIDLQRALILAVSSPGDLIVDPAAGGYSVLEACRTTGRDFIGCDIGGSEDGG